MSPGRMGIGNPIDNKSPRITITIQNIIHVLFIEYNASMRKISFTKQGLDKIIQEYDDLNAKRPAFVTELSRARDMGDRSENAAYKSARFQLSNLDRRIRRLKKIIDSANIITVNHTDYIDIGHTVKVKIDDAETEYTIVGGYESDVINGKISIHSPIGKALLRKKKGDTVLIEVPAGKKIYTILDIFC